MNSSSRDSIFTRPLTVCLFALFCNFLWGSATPSIKTGYKVFQIASSDTMSVILFAGTRFILAGILTIAFGSVLNRHFLKPKRSSIKEIAVLAVFQTILQYIFFYVGLAHTTGVKGAIFTSLGTFFAILFSALIFRMEKLTSRKLLGCLIGFAGVVLVNWKGKGTDVGGFNFAGDGALILSSAASATAAALIKRYSSKEDPVVLSGYQFFLGGLVLASAGALGGGRLAPVSASSWILMLYLGFISAAAYSIWGILLSHNPVSSVTIYGFSNPVFGVLLSALFLTETNSFSPLQCAAALVLVCIGILIVNGAGKKKQPT